jgi:glutathione synthase/RimK-type ligase-like ATP-grasp enzyme
MVVLVCGVRTEAPVKLVVQQLQQIGANCLVLNQQDLVDSVRVRWQLTSRGVAGSLRVGPHVVEIGEIGGVYLRFMSLDQMPRGKDDAEFTNSTRSIVNALLDLFDVISARIVNGRRAMLSNRSKPYQALAIRNAGFSVPNTLITNQPADARHFLAQHEAVVFKSISSVRSIVKTADQADVARLDRIRRLPTQFQERIRGTNVRVHVVGEQVFATRIVTHATDYRYAVHEGLPAVLEPCKLAKPLEEMCIRLARRLDLQLAGIDLIMAGSQVYCLEVNTSPAYSFYEGHTGQPISRALAELLCS